MTDERPSGKHERSENDRVIHKDGSFSDLCSCGELWPCPIAPPEVEPEGDAQNPDMEPMLDSPSSTLPEVEALAARGYKRINRHAAPEVQVQSKSYLKRRAIMEAAHDAPKEDYPLLDALRASLAQRGKAARDAGPSELEIPSPDLNREVRYCIAEHEVFLAFNSDWHAEAFVDWWDDEGLSAYKRWAREHRSQYD